MFGKLKEYVLQKAFNYAFSRYDIDKTGLLSKDQMTSLINDVFQLLKVNRKISWVQTTLIMKVVDSNNDGQISNSQALEACKSALTKFGGIGGITSGIGGMAKLQATKTKGGVSQPKSDYTPPDDIDFSSLDALPPPGQNLNNDDKINHPPQLKQEKKEQEEGGFIL